MNRLILAMILLTLSACGTTVEPPTPVVVTATPDLAATIESISRALTVEPPVVEPPIVDPPTVEPPTAEPPTAEPPTAEPPTAEPPTAEPPTSVPPTAAIPFGVVGAPVSVNVRSGPDTAYPILRVSARGARLEVVGRSVDGEWWQVRVPDVAGGLGWVSTIYLETQNTANVPMVSAPPPPAPPSPTPVPPTRTPAPPPPPNPTSSDSLDLRAPAIYGTYEIFPTFDSQTVDISVTGGGSINVRNAGLPSSCSGYVSEAPDVEIGLLSSASDLYIYFLSDSDSTLIVNDPFGNWYCDDDSYGGLNPMVVFRGANAGVYDIWVGRYGGSGLTQPGTLKIGEMRP